MLTDLADSTRSYENNTVIISHNLPASDDVPILNSSTLWVRTESFGLYNVEVWNTFDAEQGVAVAVSADGNKQGFYGVTLKGHGATLNARAGDQYYSHSYIEGSFNYIFGRASAWFEQCTIASNGAGVITASAREDADDPSWYVCSRRVGVFVPNCRAGLSSTTAASSGPPWPTQVSRRAPYGSATR